jgi:hypothetical protein
METKAYGFLGLAGAGDFTARLMSRLMDATSFLVGILLNSFRLPFSMRGAS